MKVSIRMGKGCRSSCQSSALLMAVLGVVHFMLLLMAAEGRYVVEQRSFTVYAPEIVSGKYDSATSSFGRPSYAGSVLGGLVYPAKGSTACAPFSKLGISFKRSGDGNDFQHAPIALIDRGGECDYAWKVYNAQLVGASGVIIADDRDEALEIMGDDDFANPSSSAKHLANVTIPSALINKSLGDKLKKALQDSQAVNAKLDWTEVPAVALTYEFWSISQDKCGEQCDTQVEFVKEFRGVAQNLEKGGYTVFTPHYIVWFCPPRFLDTKECKSECINNGRYCSPDPEDNFDAGYQGRDVVIENLRQLCIHKYLVDIKKPWVWWDFVNDFQVRCSMKEGKYSIDCADTVTTSLNIDVKKIHDCMGDPEADVENALLKAEQDGQDGKGGERGDITIAPTLVIADKQYKGKLDNGAVLKAMCGQFVEGSDPALCLGKGMETNECETDNGGCWHDSLLGVTACKDTFKGRVCECPFYQGVQFEGDPYLHCTPIGIGRCSIGNGGCWQQKTDNQSFSACSEKQDRGCKCPTGFIGDGVSGCTPIDVCKEKVACQCKECNCRSKWGGYDCSCNGDDLVYISAEDECVARIAEPVAVVAVSLSVIFGIIAVVIVVGVLAYKYKVRHYMDSRIRATLAQYMPLDNEQDIYRHLQDDT